MLRRGTVVFATLLPKVCWMFDLTCQTLKIHYPKAERPREAVAFVGILCLHQQ